MTNPDVFCENYIHQICLPFNIAWLVMSDYKEGIKLHSNEIASSSGASCKAIYGLKCIAIMRFFSILKFLSIAIP